MSIQIGPVKDYISNWMSKKSLIYLSIVILAFFLALVLIWYFSRMSQVSEILPEKSSQEQQIINKQLKKLEKLREETLPSLTDKEIQTQVKELEKLRKQTTKPILSQEEIQKQLEELEKLRRR